MNTVEAIFEIIGNVGESILTDSHVVGALKNVVSTGVQSLFQAGGTLLSTGDPSAAIALFTSTVSNAGSGVWAEILKNNLISLGLNVWHCISAALSSSTVLSLAPFILGGGLLIIGTYFFIKYVLK